MVIQHSDDDMLSEHIRWVLVSVHLVYLQSAGLDQVLNEQMPKLNVLSEFRQSDP